MNDAEVIDRLLTEDQLSAAQAAKLLPVPRGCRVHPETVTRWIRYGKQGVRLEGYKAGGRQWWTSRQAVARFLAALTAKGLGVITGPGPSEAAMARAAARARARRHELRPMTRKG